MKRTMDGLAGVYAITSPSGRQYIGGTANFANRWKAHRSHLRLGKHHSKLMQQDYDELGPGALVFSVLLVCRPQDKVFYEQILLDALRPIYNTATQAEFSQARLGIGHGDEARAKMSASRKGKPLGPFSEEHKAALSAAANGFKHSDETKAKMSASRTGKKRPPFSEAHKAKLAAARLGSKASDETKAKLSVQRVGVKHSNGNAISQALKGKPHSEERRKNQSITRLRYLANKHK